MAYAARRPESHGCEPVEDSFRLEAVQQSPRTQTLLEKLRETENPWIREYVTLGMVPPEK
jgi:hypothetical protein